MTKKHEVIMMAHETRVKKRSRPHRRSYTSQASEVRTAKLKPAIKGGTGRSLSGGGGGGYGAGLQFDKATGRFKRVKLLK